MIIVRGLIRIFFKTILLKIFLIPVLFIMGTVATSADVLGPFSVGGFYVQPDAVREAGETLRDVTEDLTVLEINILRRFIQKGKKLDIDEAIGRLHRIKNLAERSI